MANATDEYHFNTSMAYELRLNVPISELRIVFGYRAWAWILRRHGVSTEEGTTLGIPKKIQKATKK